MISDKKIEIEKNMLIANCKRCFGKGCGSCFGYCAFIDKMAEAEIPVDYWFRNMKDFYGEKNFKEIIISYIENLDSEYKNGYTLCFAGHRGTGKTMAACSILKKALLNGYLVNYTTMVDLVGRCRSWRPARPSSSSSTTRSSTAFTSSRRSATRPGMWRSRCNRTPPAPSCRAT